MQVQISDPLPIILSKWEAVKSYALPKTLFFWFQF